MPKRFSDNPILNLFQHEALNRIRKVEDSPLSDAELIEDVDLTSTPTSVKHSLGRVPSGYIVVASTAYADVKHTEMDSGTLNLAASASTRVSLLVF